MVFSGFSPLAVDVIRLSGAVLPEEEDDDNGELPEEDVGKDDVPSFAFASVVVFAIAMSFQL